MESWLENHGLVGVIWFDHAGVVFRVNARARTLVGDDLVGQQMEDLFHESDVLDLLHTPPDVTVALTPIGRTPIGVVASPCPGGTGLVFRTWTHRAPEERRLLSWPELNPFPVAEYNLQMGEIAYLNTPARAFPDALQRFFRETEESTQTDSVFPAEVAHAGRIYRGVCQHIASLQCLRLYLQDDTENAELLEKLQFAQGVLKQRVEQHSQALAGEVVERQEAEHRALAAGRAKSSFLENMSHELRTPLNAILGYTELMMERTGSAGFSKDLTRVHGAAKHLLVLVSDVLDLAKIEAGKLDLQRVEVDSNALLAEVADTARPWLQSGVALHLQISDAPVLFSDGERVAQIVRNLLSNACKFTSTGTVTLRTTVEDGRLRIRVRDTGVGIESDALLRIFEPFEQAVRKEEAEEGGTGLGLAISVQLARLLGGQISAASTPGQGSTFSLWLPLQNRV